MKIICKDKAEYDSLMRTSRYLHDYVGIINNLKSSRASINGEFEMMPTLTHLYLEGHDFPDKDQYVTIESEQISKPV